MTIRYVRQLQFYVLSVFFFLTIPSFIEGQTIGHIFGKDIATDGYCLFSPFGNSETYLITNSGRIVNQWTSAYKPGLTVYLDDEGNLYRAGRIENININQGGAGGIIEKFNWEGNVIWSFVYSNESVRQHHDFELLPNGNILLIAWEEFSKDQAFENGRDPDLLNAQVIWADHIVEIESIGSDQANIVWQWRVWDHLVQDFDETKLNFGDVSENIGKVDINFIDLPISDWNHSNSIDYNPSYDEILLSVRSFSEIWIIDHSTTTEEAMGNSGGNHGKGGELIFRWGNPEASKAPANDGQTLFKQHGAKWIPQGSANADKIILFNNGLGRPGENHSSLEIIEPLRILDDYHISDQNSNEYVVETETLFAMDTLALFSPLFSRAQQLPNGNYQVCVGTRGTFVEMTTQGDILWKYISPVREDGVIMSQGESIGDHIQSINSVFAVEKYSPDFVGFIDKDLTPGNFIESGTVVAINDISLTKFFNVYIDSDLLSIMSKGKEKLESVIIYSFLGKQTYREILNTSNVDIDVSGWMPAMYLLVLNEKYTRKIALF